MSCLLPGIFLRQPRIIQSQDVTGKPSGSDEKNKKTTYVTLEGLDKAKKDVEQISTEAIEELNKLPGNNDFLEQLEHGRWL